MPVDAGRKAAFEALNDVLIKRAYADLAAKERFQGLPDREARFARKLLYQTLDRLFAIDWALAPHLDWEGTPTRVLNAMRLGVCQLFYLDAVPDFAALNSAVELVREDGHESRVALTNAVLRNVVRAGRDIALPDRETDLAGHLSVEYSWPRFVVELWLREQPEVAEALMAWEPPYRLTVRPNGLAGGTAQELEQFFKENEIDYARGALVPDAFGVKGQSDLTKWELFTQGRLTAQGEASQFVSRIAAQIAGPGAEILDACAAPGGKTACMADALGGNCAITAWDVHLHRVGLMKATFQRLKVKALAELHDARFSDSRRFDFVLVDAPCSGLGVAWSSPDIKISRRPEDIPSLTATQKKIVRNTAGCVKVGGHLLYSTCTISHAENEDILRDFLRTARAFRPADLGQYLPEHLRPRVKDGMLQLLPPVDGVEGFFLGLLTRVKE